jgi:hypothetical protein
MKSVSLVAALVAACGATTSAAVNVNAAAGGEGISVRTRRSARATDGSPALGSAADCTFVSSVTNSKYDFSQLGCLTLPWNAGTVNYTYTVCPCAMQAATCAGSSPGPWV